MVQYVVDTLREFGQAKCSYMNSTSRIIAAGNWPVRVEDGNTAIPSYPSSIFLNSTLECKIIGIGMALDDSARPQSR